MRTARQLAALSGLLLVAWTATWCERWRWAVIVVILALAMFNGGSWWRG
jgi:hypothetical protein